MRLRKWGLYGLSDRRDFSGSEGTILSSTKTFVQHEVSH